MANVFVSDVLGYARLLAKTDSFGMTDTNGTAFLNDALYDLRKKLISFREDLFVQEAQRSITSVEINTGASPGKFLFPSDMWLLKNIQVNMIDSTNQNLYYEAAQVDSSNIQANTSWEWVKKNQPIDRPVFDYRGDWFEIAPTPTQTMSNALKIFYFLAPTDLNTTSGTLAFPENLDMRILAYKTAAIYLGTLNDPRWAEFDKKYTESWTDLLKVIGSGEQAPTRSSIIHMSGFEF